MTDPLTAAIIFAVFLLAGGVKGLVGFGLPTVSLGLLTVAFDLTTAMVLLLVPSFATNVWQAAVGGNGRAILSRIWPFLVTATGTVWIGALALARVDLAWLSALLGLLLVIYAGLNLAGVRMTLTSRQETCWGPLIGIVNGVVTGMTGSFVVPGVLYLQAIGLSRDMLVQAMGIFFTLSTVALALALRGNGVLDLSFGAWSGAALAPAALGMAAGQRIRKRLSEERFRQILFVGLLMLGAYITARSALTLA
ncbi:MAG: sulfite exporter TauE/SafE family protein [Deltaproteobacteria bacterium]|nr:sulfite exporter TauE/SafE family protein [Deltaproteobacteria bacterium]